MHYFLAEIHVTDIHDFSSINTLKLYLYSLKTLSESHFKHQKLQRNYSFESISTPLRVIMRHGNVTEAKISEKGGKYLFTSFFPTKKGKSNIKI